jgi:hypothetical protein
MSDPDGSSTEPQSFPPEPPDVASERPSSAPEPPSAAPQASNAAPELEGEAAPERENIIDAVADLLQMVVNWLRQEAAGIMRDKVVLPGQQLGMLVAFAMAAAALLVIGLCFLFVSFLMVLAGWIGWPGAFAVVGTAILVGAGVLTYLKMRSIQS